MLTCVRLPRRGKHHRRVPRGRRTATALRCVPWVAGRTAQHPKVHFWEFTTIYGRSGRSRLPLLPFQAAHLLHQGLRVPQTATSKWKTGPGPRHLDRTCSRQKVPRLPITVPCQMLCRQRRRARPKKRKPNLWQHQRRRQARACRNLPRQRTRTIARPPEIDAP